MKQNVRNTHFPIGMCAEIFLIMLLVAGIHTGINVFFDLKWNPGPVIAPMIMIIYWALIALGVTLFIRAEMKKSYEEPMKKLAEATDKVANGDFSVYIAPLHTADRLDYMDVMLMGFNKMVEELGSIETLKTDFFSNVSHEIKTPLSVITYTAENMKTDKALTETQLEQVETIRSSAGRLADLITNILKLNRLEKQTIQAEPVKYDVCEQLCDCVLQFENRWNEKEINLEAEIDDRAYIEADPGLMELVWNNLLSNALKFTEKGGTVHVSEHLQKDSIEIEVTDTGCGMTEETKNRIFEKFYQGDTSHATEGNGLGMALVFRILQISNGTIKVNSASGKGTTIIVTLNLSNKDRGE